MQRPKILIIDDEADICERLSKFLRKKINCQIEKSGDGKEALKKLKTENFDLVLLDIKMPGLNGIEVIKEAARFTPQTKFLVISGYDSEEVAKEALAAGAIDYVTKPQDIDALWLKVKSVFS